MQKATNPFAAAQQQPEEPATAAAAASSDPPNILDLFGMSGGGANPNPGGVAEANKASDDLLQLSGVNPFASVLNSNANNSASTTTNTTAAPNSSSNFGGNAFPESNANGQFCNHLLQQ